MRNSIQKSIAIIRGSHTDRVRSLENGRRAILALLKYEEEVQVLDVSLDENNNWFERGIPADPHKVFSKVDYYLDFTNNFKADYHALAKRLKVKALFQDDYVNSLNRVSLNRLLEQLNILVPKYTVIHNIQNLELDLKNIWSKFQMPVVIKEVSHNFNEKSLVTYSYLEAFRKIQQILVKGSEVMVQEFTQGKYLSTAILPGYREEDNYVPSLVEIINFDPLDKDLNSQTLNQKCLIGHNCEKQSFVFVDNKLKKDIQEFVKNIQKTILFNQHSMIDLAILENKKNKKYSFKVLDIHTNPNIFEDSRFDFILKNSGVDLGRFIIDRIEKLENQT